MVHGSKTKMYVRSFHKHANRQIQNKIVSRVSSLSIACHEGRYGERCSNLCSETCGGLANTCDRVDGACKNGCDPGYTGTKCDQGKLSCYWAQTYSHRYCDT